MVVCEMADILSRPQWIKTPPLRIFINTEFFTFEKLVTSGTHQHGPLTRYVKLLVMHAPGMPGTFSLQPLFSDPDMHHGTCVTHVSWCMLGLLASCFLWSRWRRKRSRHSRRIRNLQFYVSGKRSIGGGFMINPSAPPNNSRYTWMRINHYIRTFRNADDGYRNWPRYGLRWRPAQLVLCRIAVPTTTAQTV